MALGIRGGMGVEARKLLKQAFALKLSVFHSCDTHDCKTHGNWAGGGEVKKRGDAAVDDDPFGVSRPSTRRAKLGKLVGGVPGVEAEELKEIRDKRKAEVTGPRLRFENFPDEVGPLRAAVRIEKDEKWLTKEEFLALKGMHRVDGRFVSISAVERYAQGDLHGLIVVGKDGRFLDPFNSSHAVIRLAQTGMPKLINRVIPKIQGEEALSVELKPGRVGESTKKREKNRLYMLAGEKAGKKVALNVVLLPSGDIQTAFVEFADGSYAHPTEVRKALKDAKVNIPNNIVRTEEYGVPRVRRNRGGGRR